MVLRSFYDSPEVILGVIDVTNLQSQLHFLAETGRVELNTAIPDNGEEAAEHHWNLFLNTPPRKRRKILPSDSPNSIPIRPSTASASTVIAEDKKRASKKAGAPSTSGMQ